MRLDSILLSSGIFRPIFTNEGIENVSVDRDGDAVKIYSDLVDNNLSVGIQPSGTDHDSYKDLEIIDLGDLY